MFSHKSRSCQRELKATNLLFDSLKTTNSVITIRGSVSNPQNLCTTYKVLFWPRWGIKGIKDLYQFRFLFEFMVHHFEPYMVPATLRLESWIPAQSQIVSIKNMMIKDKQDSWLMNCPVQNLRYLRIQNKFKCHLLFIY